MGAPKNDLKCFDKEEKEHESNKYWDKNHDNVHNSDSNYVRDGDGNNQQQNYHSGGDEQYLVGVGNHSNFNDILNLG